MAMVLAEPMGVEDLRQRVKIYATDVDEEALAQARAARYTPRQVEGVPPTFLSRYFDRANDDTFAFRKDLRQAVIFGRHDLVQDAPISRVDLLMCRNTLMYLNSDTQARVMGNFYFALCGGRIPRPRQGGDAVHPVPVVPPGGPQAARVRQEHVGRGRPGPAALMSQRGVRGGGSISNHVRGRESAFELGPVGQIVVDRDGAPSGERPGALVVRTVDHRRRPPAPGPRRVVPAGRAPFAPPACSRQTASPSGSATCGGSSTGLACGSRSRWSRWRTRPGRSSGRASRSTRSPGSASSRRSSISRTRSSRPAMEELQSTNEELETTNEELQSTNEELETTNEELQSTNEELETMNEELQSTNEELQTINDELNMRSTDLGRTNSFLESILKGMQGGVVVTDTDFAVQVWNRVAEDMWGLRAEEVLKQPLFSLDIGLPIEPLRWPLQQAMDGVTSENTFDARNRRGKPFHCRVTCMPCAAGDGKRIGVILIMVDIDATM